MVVDQAREIVKFPTVEATWKKRAELKNGSLRKPVEESGRRTSSGAGTFSEQQLGNNNKGKGEEVGSGAASSKSKSARGQHEDEGVMGWGGEGKTSKTSSGTNGQGSGTSGGAGGGCANVGGGGSWSFVEDGFCEGREIDETDLEGNRGTKFE